MSTATVMYHWGRGLELRLEREDLGLAMQEFADQLGIAYRTIQRWEGDIDPIPEEIWGRVTALSEKLQRRLDQQVEEILNGVKAEQWPKFYPVPTGHIRARIAAALAQQQLIEEFKVETKLVSEKGLRSICRYGYEDPLNKADTP